MNHAYNILMLGGRRVDEIHTSDGWQALGHVAAQEGLIAIAYERRSGALSRIHQAAKLYLFNPVSAIYTCPLAMSDGAARLIEVHGDTHLKEKVLPLLTSRDPTTVWTSGQWMTERAGGSDVSASETSAKRICRATRSTEQNGLPRPLHRKWP